MTTIARKPAPAKAAPKPAVKKTAKSSVKSSAPSAAPSAIKAATPRKRAAKKSAAPKNAILDLVQRSLEDDKAEDIVVIDMADKSAIADFMVIATGRSQRQLGAMADHLRTKLKATGMKVPPIEGLAQGDWVLVDAGDVIAHLFRPEVRTFYNLEKMWSQPLAESDNGMAGLVKERSPKSGSSKKAGARKGAKAPRAARAGRRAAG